MRVPGFRKGKVPAAGGAPAGGTRGRARRGRATRASRLVRGCASGGGHRHGRAVPTWTSGGLPEKGAPLAFTFEVGVRPRAELGDYEGVEVGRREPEVAEEDVNAELDRLRESLASLETVEREAAQRRLRGHRLRRLGRRRALRGRRRPRLPARARLRPADPGLRGAARGRRRRATSARWRSPSRTTTRRSTWPARRPPSPCRVKEVKEKRLPELDDDLAIEAGGYDSLDELTEDLRTRLREAHEDAIEREFREAAVDAVAAAGEDRRAARRSCTPRRTRCGT